MYHTARNLCLCTSYGYISEFCCSCAIPGNILGGCDDEITRSDSATAVRGCCFVMFHVNCRLCVHVSCSFFFQSRGGKFGLALFERRGVFFFFSPYILRIYLFLSRISVTFVLTDEWSVLQHAEPACVWVSGAWVLKVLFKGWRRGNLFSSAFFFPPLFACFSG